MQGSENILRPHRDQLREMELMGILMRTDPTTLQVLYHALLSGGTQRRGSRGLGAHFELLKMHEITQQRTFVALYERVYYFDENFFSCFLNIFSYRWYFLSLILRRFKHYVWCWWRWQSQIVSFTNSSFILLTLLLWIVYHTYSMS